MINYNAWLSAIRIRTLPLALASIGMGSFLAAEAGYFRWSVFLLCAITTIFLQILSNLANDYGDSIHGADSILRDGPSRAVQSGAIAPGIMRKAIALFVILSLVSGITLLYIALGLNIQAILLFFFIGIMAIIAAIAYTAGKKPYGYAGLGDFSVFLFFGIVGVAGTYYLYVKEISWLLILPAVSCGMFATAVLNLNNVRDISSDKSAGKKSIPVRIGRDRAVIYHYLLLILGFITAFLFTVLYFKSYFQFLFILAVPLLVKNAIAIKTRKTAMELDPFLKQMAIATLVFVLMFGIGILL
jgi:1,4-dihydroxy-2-naphthoate octaprenyltransferase